jgi:hypothetical protein
MSSSPRETQFDDLNFRGLSDAGRVEHPYSFFELYLGLLPRYHESARECRCCRRLPSREPVALCIIIKHWVDPLLRNPEYSE